MIYSSSVAARARAMCPRFVLPRRDADRARRLATPSGRWLLVGAFALFVLARLLGSSALVAADAPPPNVVLIMTDNHGAWTLGCYGNRDIRTPHLDRLAQEGTRFSHAFSSNPVCSPTRATFLTGLLPSQHGVHCFLTGGRLQVGPGARNTLAEFTSLPEILQREGYACGLVGKWHLGDNLHPQESFDAHWITMPHGGTSTFYNARVIEAGAIRTEPQYLTDFWTDQAVDFIDRQSGEDRPFFLFLSYNGPYALSRLLLRQGQNRHAADYAQQELPSFPREPSHPWQYSNRDYASNPTSMLKLRYKEPEGSTSTLIEFPAVDAGAEFAAASDDFQFAAAVAGFGMALRRSPYGGDWSLGAVAETAAATVDGEAAPRRQEFLQLVRRAAELSATPLP